MEINITWTICRICLHDEQVDATNGASATKMRTIDQRLAKQIYICSGTTMESNENLPEKICPKCIRLLKYAMCFRTTCRKSDEYLKGIIQKTKSATSFFKTAKKGTDTVDIEEEDYEEVLVESDDQQEETNENVDTEEQKKLTETIIAKKKKKLKIDHDGDTESVNSAVNTKKTEEKQTSIKLGSVTHEVDVLVSPTRRKRRGKAVAYYMNKIPTETNEQNDDDNEPRNNSECSNDEEYYGEDAENLAEILKRDDKDEDSEMEDKGSVKENKSNKVSSTEKYYYLLNNEIKQEYEQIDDESGIEFIPLENMDSDVRSEPTNVSADEVEYIVEEEANQISDTHSQSDEHNSGKGRSEANVDSLKAPQKKKGDFICDVCANHFTSRNLLNYHMRIHRNEKNYECELCFKRFNASCNLSAHMRIHTGEKPFECQYCGRRFSDRSTHIKHERVHTNEKPFLCNACGKTFSLSTSLKAHIKVHTGEKPYKCEPCEKSFKLAHQLKAHLNTYLHKTVAVDH